MTASRFLLPVAIALTLVLLVPSSASADRMALVAPLPLPSLGPLPVPSGLVPTSVPGVATKAPGNVGATALNPQPPGSKPPQAASPAPSQGSGAAVPAAAAQHPPVPVRKPAPRRRAATRRPPAQPSFAEQTRRLLLAALLTVGPMLAAARDLAVAAMRGFVILWGHLSAGVATIHERNADTFAVLPLFWPAPLLLFVLLVALARGRRRPISPPAPAPGPSIPFMDPSGLEPPNLAGLSRRLAAASLVERTIASARARGQRLVLALIQVDRADAEPVRVPIEATEPERSLTAPVALALSRTLGPDDSVVRYAGDEFICLLPQKDLRTAKRVLERSRREMEAMPGNRVKIGMANMRRGESAQQLIARAGESVRGRAARDHDRAGRPRAFRLTRRGGMRRAGRLGGRD